MQAVRRLLAAGADYDALNSTGRSALVYACMGPDLREQKGLILTMLLQVPFCMHRPFFAFAHA